MQDIKEGCVGRGSMFDSSYKLQILNIVRISDLAETGSVCSQLDRGMWTQLIFVVTHDG